MHVHKLMTSAGLACFYIGLVLAGAHAQGAYALTGQVTSAEEGAMEGVLVSAKKDGSNITVTVVTDAGGRLQSRRAQDGRY
jgi:virginiamycin B lyase